MTRVTLQPLPPLSLPLHAVQEPVALAAGHDEVGASDGVPDREASGPPNCCGEGRQLCALEQEGADVWVLEEGLLGKPDHTFLHQKNVDSIAQSDGLKPWNVLAADHDDPPLPI